LEAALATEVLKGEAEFGQDVVISGAKGDNAEDEAVNTAKCDPGRVR
jgi:hypothetical protein